MARRRDRGNKTSPRCHHSAAGSGCASTTAASSPDLFDRAYVEHLSFQRDPFRSGVRLEAPGRSFYINVSLRF